jgi:hypothetical protein
MEKIMDKKKLSFGAIIGFCGACIAFYIGAGFATMQEVMQYEASYGTKLWIVIAVISVIYIYTNLSFSTNGNRLKLLRGGDIYNHYCGKYIGTFYDYFSAFFCYMCFIVMCGGANSTATQQWGLPNGVGAVILTVCVIATALFGLDGILNALGKIGPLIIVIILLVSVISAINGAAYLSKNLEYVNSGAVENGKLLIKNFVDASGQTRDIAITQVGNGNPFLSGFSYGGFVILWFAAFLAEVGAKNKLKEVNFGMLLSTVFIMGTAVLASYALICYIGETGEADIPALVLAKSISPILAQALAVIIFCGIYTTSVPLLWTGVGKISKEGTKKYKVLTVVGGVIGCVAACFLPYKGLVNVLYGMNGYLGFILVAFMIVYDLRTRMSKTKMALMKEEKSV